MERIRCSVEREVLMGSCFFSFFFFKEEIVIIRPA